MVDTPRKTFPELQALSAPLVDSDVLAVYRTPGPAKRTTASVIANYIKAFFSPATGSTLVGWISAGTGSILRTLSGRSSDTVHVFDFIPVALHAGIKDGTNTTNVGDYLTACFDYATSLAGACEVFMPAGRYHCTTTPVITRPPTYFGNVNISAYGAYITTAGAIFALEARDGGAENLLTVSGLRVQHYPSTDAAGAFLQTGAANTTWRDCFVLTGTTSVATYAGWKLVLGTAGDPDTGCFWTKWPGSKLRGVDGADLVPIGVWMLGGHNSADLNGMWISNVVDAIIMEKAYLGGQNANSVRANNLDVEACTNAIHYKARFSGEVSGTSPFALEMIGGRYEDVTGYMLKLVGADTDSARPPVIGPNCLIQSVAGIVQNPDGVQVNVNLSGTASIGESLVYNADGTVFKADVDDALTVRGANASVGLAFENLAGVKFGYLRYMESQGLEMVGNTAANIYYRMRGVGGMSTTGTVSRNFAGISGALSSGSVTVTFPEFSQANTTYSVQLTPLAAVTAPLYVSARATGSFTITTTDTASTATVAWLIVQH